MVVALLVAFTAKMSKCRVLDGRACMSKAQFLKIAQPRGA